MALQNNLLISLHQWAQDENFVTDSFAHLVSQLLENDSSVAVDILARLTDGQFPPVGADSKQIRIRTQVTHKLGRPDIEISWGEHKVHVEVKVDSGLGDDQLGRYRRELCHTVTDGHHALVLLSRHAVAIDPALEDYVISKRWFEVVDWLNQHQLQDHIQHPINKFLTRQFTEFAEHRGMTIEKVGPELIGGMSAVRNLCKMIQLWIEGQKRSFGPSFGRDWSGWYTHDGSKDYFVGIHHHEPQVLVLENEGAKLDAEAVSKLGTFRYVRRSYGMRWCRELDLSSPDVCFFDLSREMQITTVENFLSESLTAAESVRVKPPYPDTATPAN